MRARRRLTGYFSFALAPDSNVNNATGNRLITIFDLPFVLNQTATATSGIGYFVSGGAEYQLPVTQQLRWKFGIDGNLREYKGQRFDQTYLAIRSGPRYLLSEQSELSLQAVLGYRWLAGSVYSRETGLRVDVAHQLSQRLQLKTDIFWRKRKHPDRGTSDGSYTDYGVEASYLLTPTTQVFTRINFSRGRPKAINLRQRQYSVQTGINLALSKGWNIGGSIQHLRRNFEGTALFTPGSVAQKDSLLSFRLNVLNRGFTIYGFSPQISLYREKQKSNSPLAQFARNRAELTFTRQF